MDEMTEEILDAMLEDWEELSRLDDDGCPCPPPEAEDTEEIAA